MEWKTTVQEAPLIVPEGTYNAVLTSIEQENTEVRPLVKIGFTIIEGTYEGQNVFGLCSGIINSMSKLGNWMKIMKGDIPPAGEEVKASDLIGTECRIIITHTKKKNGSIFANVDEVLSPSPQNDVPF
jgi:hypothetical protein